MSFTVSEIAGLQASKYFNVAGMAILIFDYVITLEDEVRWVWGRSWDATRLVFTVSRYLPFVGMGMTAYCGCAVSVLSFLAGDAAREAALRSNSEPCGPSLEENIIHILGVVAAEVLLVLRAYAFWQGDKRVLYGLLAYGGVTIGAAVAINITPTQLLSGEKPPPGCLLIASRNSTFVYLFLLVFELVILVLTAYRHFRVYHISKTSIVYTTYRDAMFYIICIMLITFANVLVDGAFPFQFSDIFDVPQIVLHSVLASRIMFNLRKSSHRLQNPVTTDSNIQLLSDVVFYPRSGPHANVSEVSRSETRA